MKITISPWTVEHSGSARERTMDIKHVAKRDVLDAAMLNVPWDGNTGEYSREITRADMREALKEWIEESSADYLRELPYLS